MTATGFTVHPFGTAAEDTACRIQRRGSGVVREPAGPGRQRCGPLRVGCCIDIDLDLGPGPDPEDIGTVAR